jgi:hypothetical protein
MCPSKYLVSLLVFADRAGVQKRWIARFQRANRAAEAVQPLCRTGAEFRKSADFAMDEWLHALIALDESPAGRTYREITITIYGEKRAAEDWQGSSQYLKDRMRRLVAKSAE